MFIHADYISDIKWSSYSLTVGNNIEFHNGLLVKIFVCDVAILIDTNFKSVLLVVPWPVLTTVPEVKLALQLMLHRSPWQHPEHGVYDLAFKPDRFFPKTIGSDIWLLQACLNDMKITPAIK